VGGGVMEHSGNLVAGVKSCHKPLQTYRYFGVNAFPVRAKGWKPRFVLVAV